MPECLGIYGASEHGNDLIAKDQVYRTKHQSTDNYHNNRIADTLLSSFSPLFSKAQTDKGAAAVADHYCNSQSNDRKRKYHRIGSIPV